MVVAFVKETGWLGGERDLIFLYILFTFWILYHNEYFYQAYHFGCSL